MKKGGGQPNVEDERYAEHRRTGKRLIIQAYGVEKLHVTVGANVAQHKFQNF